MDWLLQDLQLESIEERIAMFRRFKGADAAAWETEHDRIRLLRDTDGDGVYDSDTVFADGFSNLEDGTGAGVLEHNGRVFYACIPKLWSLSDTDGDGVAEEQTALHHGYGVRVAFRGHDLHGLTVGPDGRIYFSIGDRGYNVITQEGGRLKRPDTGAVFRCFPNGSHLEVFAYGLRNPQELAFDNAGNLFTGDNNSDSGDQARWVYVVEDGDTGWRMYFQYLDDRGPWNRERIWYPWQADAETAAVQPAATLPPIANLGNGPSGLVFYPGTGLSDRYNDHFFSPTFVESAPTVAFGALA
jgi:quinoprotein glucose dehydrogenase